jgi:hypothetical protein
MFAAGIKSVTISIYADDFHSTAGGSGKGKTAGKRKHIQHFFSCGKIPDFFPVIPLIQKESGFLTMQ